MANTLVVSGTFVLTENLIQAVNRTFAATSLTVTGNGAIHQPAFATSTASQAIPLGGLSGTLGAYFFLNLDATNNITIQTALSGTNILTLTPGMFAIGQFSSNITAPGVIASAGTPLLEYAICPA